MMFTKSSGAMYEQIKADLVAKIQSGEYKSDNRLPSERQMEELYQVSRVTIRKAVDDLVHQGVLIRRQGAGTFVANRKLTVSMRELKGIMEELQDNGLSPESQLCQCQYLAYSPDLQDIWNTLNVSESEQVFFVQRLYSHQEMPLVIENNYFPAYLGEELEVFNLEKNILYKALSMIGHPVERAQQIMSARLADTQERKLLQLKQNIAVLNLERLNLSAENEPLLFARGVFAGDKYSYTTMLHRGAGM